jgi:DNA-binding MarR family transcriptional regulator
VRATRENLGYLLAKASQRWNALLRERFAARGFGEVRPAYGSVLLPLFEQDGLRMSEIAARSRLSKQTMTTLVRATERAGLVARERDREDGRAFRIRLTARGRAFHPVAEDVLAELDQLVASSVSNFDLETTRRILKGVMTL